MPPAVAKTIQQVERNVKQLPRGTNINLFRLIMTILSGKFLESRGALFTALEASGYGKDEIYRISESLRCGVWNIDELIASQLVQMKLSRVWKPQEREGYRVIGVDLTAIFRPKLQGEVGKYHHGPSGKAISGIGYGLLVEVGQVNDRRVSVVRKIVTETPDSKGQTSLKKRTLQIVGRNLQANEIAVHDAGSNPAEFQATGIARWVLRMAKNCTARRNTVMQTGRGRRREYGNLVRPLARKRKGKSITASEADEEHKFEHQGRSIVAKVWRNLVCTKQKTAPDNQLFDIWVFEDPKYTDPLVLATNVTALKPKSVYLIYSDRWLVEHPPLVAKQLLGMHRQFVFNPTARQRLGALGLLAGNILSLLAASLPVQRTNFWDRTPKRTAGRLRRQLAKWDFSKYVPRNPHISKKASVTSHLPKGVIAHRRLKTQFSA